MATSAKKKKKKKEKKKKKGYKWTYKMETDP